MRQSSTSRKRSLRSTSSCAAFEAVPEGDCRNGLIVAVKFSFNRAPGPDRVGLVDCGECDDECRHRQREKGFSYAPTYKEDAIRALRGERSSTRYSGHRNYGRQ